MSAEMVIVQLIEDTSGHVRELYFRLGSTQVIRVVESMSPTLWSAREVRDERQ